MAKGSRFISNPDCFATFYFFHALYCTHTHAHTQAHTLVRTVHTGTEFFLGARDSFGNSTRARII